jgi:hypothetical protein
LADTDGEKKPKFVETIERQLSQMNYETVSTQL